MEPNRDLRVAWAEERTVLAIARALASWIRTGLGMIGVALGMHFVFRSPASLILGRLTASLFLAIAIALFIGGEYRRDGCKASWPKSTSSRSAPPMAGSPPRLWLRH